MSINKGLLKWRCKRGMRELDYILRPYFDSHIDELDDASLQNLKEILDLPDPDLHYLLVTENIQIPEQFEKIILDIRAQAGKPLK